MSSLNLMLLMSSGLRASDFDTLDTIHFSVLLILSLLASFIAIIWIVVIIVYKLNIRKRESNLMKFRLRNSSYNDVTNIVEGMRVRNKILSFSLLVVLIELILIMSNVINYIIHRYCLKEDIQLRNSSCYTKLLVESPIITCRIYFYSNIAIKTIALCDLSIFGISLFYIKSLIEKAKSPLKSIWKHILMVACGIISIAIITTYQNTTLFSKPIYGILFQFFLIYSMIGARKLYQQFTIQQRDLVHFNRPDRFEILRKIEGFKKRFKLIILIIYGTVQVNLLLYFVHSILFVIEEIFVNTCQIEYNFKLRLHINLTTNTKTIIRKLVFYSGVLVIIFRGILVINIFLINIVYGLQGLRYYFSKRKTYRYNSANIFKKDPKQQRLLQDHDRAILKYHY